VICRFQVGLSQFRESILRDFSGGRMRPRVSFGPEVFDPILELDRVSDREIRAYCST